MQFPDGDGGGMIGIDPFVPSDDADDEDGMDPSSR
jgi:hypothetical protein